MAESRKICMNCESLFLKRCTLYVYNLPHHLESTNLRLFQAEGFKDDNFKYDENGGKHIRTIPPPDNCLRTTPPCKFPRDNCPQDKSPLRQSPPGQFPPQANCPPPPDNSPPQDCYPLDNSPQTTAPQITACCQTPPPPIIGPRSSPPPPNLTRNFFCFCFQFQGRVQLELDYIRLLMY